ncbi:MAG: glycine--tRNA ligase, partial [Pirellulales bacterium]|nr:glycine--tRNA ligase [Pirellulales bacterium]
YGPLGVELKKNIKDAWWQDMVRGHDELAVQPGAPSEYEMTGLDCTIIMHPQVWKVSGHYDLFHDWMQTCRQCKKLVRADHVWNMIKESPWALSFAETMELTNWSDKLRFNSLRTLQWAKSKGRKTAPNLAIVRSPEVTMSWLAEDLEKDPNLELDLPTLLQYMATEQKNQTGLQTPCPHCGGDLTEPREFNLMFETHTGAVQTEESKTFLRPETAQGIFVNFKNVLDSTRVKVPFGIAQVGKSFRNEITPRNFTFRSREFEQMEIEFFCHPNDSRKWYEYWRDRRMKWYTELGLAGERLIMREHAADELSHYSVGTADIEYAFPFLPEGEHGELEGVAHRGDFDLRSHMEGKLVKNAEGCLEVEMVEDENGKKRPKHKGSGRDLQYRDEVTNEKFTPHVIEPSAGADRATLAFLCEAYHEDQAPDEKGEMQTRVVMKFHPRIAPIKAAVFPLVKKDGMPEIAQDIYRRLKAKFSAFYDEKGAVGRRYRRQDEAGTPFCITVDGQTLTDRTVTIRDRDTLEQWRVKIDDVVEEISRRVQ